MELNFAFTAEDLANVRFAISPMQHLLIGVQHNFPALPARRWWRRVRSRIPARGASLIELVNAHRWYVPDFLSPPITSTSGIVSIDEELDVIRAVGAEQMAGELARYAELNSLPRPVEELLDSGRRRLHRLADAAYALYKAGLAEDWPMMCRQLRADISLRTATMGNHGTGRMLAELHPAFRDPSRFQSDIPHTAPAAPRRLARCSSGSGFLLTPNLLLDGQLAPSVSSPWQQPLFTYSASSEVRQPAADQDGLVALIGKGKAGALRAIEAGCTTSALAARLGVSASAASQHAKTLRAAGLISTVRDGSGVVHSLTLLGSGLLAVNPAAG